MGQPEQWLLTYIEKYGEVGRGEKYSSLRLLYKWFSTSFPYYMYYLHGHQEETIRYLGRSGQLVQTVTSTQKIYLKQVVHKKCLKMPKVLSAAVCQ